MHSRTLGSKSMHSESEPVSMRARPAPTLRVSGGYHRGYALQVNRSSLCSSLKEFRTPTSTERNTFLLGIVFGQKRHFLFLKQPHFFFKLRNVCLCSHGQRRCCEPLSTIHPLTFYAIPDSTPTTHFCYSRSPVQSKVTHDLFKPIMMGGGRSHFTWYDGLWYRFICNVDSQKREKVASTMRFLQKLFRQHIQKKKN